MRILMLTYYPPMRSGIAAYAGQAVTRLRDQGHEVAVASPEPSDAEHVIDLSRRGAGVALARLARRFDRLIVQFHPELLGSPDSSLATRSLSMVRLALGLAAARSSELCIHEMTYGAGPTAPLQRALARPVWTLADEITMHSEREREDFAKGFRIRRDRIGVVSQARDMVRHVTEDRDTARAALGLAQAQTILVAIGFLQPHKGFDRAMRAFAQVPHAGARLYVVGSTWRDDPAAKAHLDELRRLAEETPDAELRAGYLDDAEFDRWIVAADALVLPYRHGFSSNVMERGLLYERPVIVSGTSGMAEQGEDRRGVSIVADDSELVAALRAFLADPALGRASAPRTL
jgi:glycosyltransferase involved in cell wall biosynthesis